MSDTAKIERAARALCARLCVWCVACGRVCAVAARTRKRTHKHTNANSELMRVGKM